MNYQDFISRKQQQNVGDGFEPIHLPDYLFPFQRHLVEWALRKGRAAILADCGLGKTIMQLVWADNVAQHTDRPVVILTPLAVSQQTVREGEQFGIEVHRSRLGEMPGRIIATNYERLHYFKPEDFAGIVCDESSILKNADGATRTAVTAFASQIRYRLLCTATAAPNDCWELGTSSEALGYLGFRDMLTAFFKQDVKKDFLGWGRVTYRFRGHAEQPFWRWVCGWARAIRKPSDIGFSDDGFDLPPLRETEIVIDNSTPREGMLFSIPARDLREQREERRITIRERCERVAELVGTNGTPTVSWCHLNAEGDLLERIIPGAKQIKGSMDDDQKEEYLIGFQSGEIKHLVTKPKIGCFGLNWQHCSTVTTFPSHSWEQYYQLVRRCWRFGQKNPVDVKIITTPGEVAVIKNLQRKAQQADTMFSHLVANMNNVAQVDAGWHFNNEERVPAWL